MQQHADAHTPGVLAQLLLFCQLLHVLMHASRGPTGRNAEFHALTSCPAIPYAAVGANARGAVLAFAPKCTYNRGIETK